MSPNLFILLTGLAILLALAFTLWPLFGSRGGPRRQLGARIRKLEAERVQLDEDEYRSRRTALAEELMAAESRQPQLPWALTVFLVVLVPALTLFLYQVVGTPDGVQTAETRSESFSYNLARLARQLERNPDDAQGWMALGLSYKQLEQWSSAEQTLRRSLLVEPDNPQARVELAETLMFASDRNRLPTESRLLLVQAVDQDPTHQKALWLLGIAEFQAGQYDQALGWWQQLDDLLDDGSVRRSVREQMARARDAAGHPGETGATGATEPGTGIIQARVSLAGEFDELVQGQEVLFVYARAMEGPPMPVAIQRISAGQLPVTLELGDHHAMAEGVSLSDFEKVQVVARISFSGDAVPVAGDLQGTSSAIDLTDDHPVQVSLVIDQRME